MQRALAALVLCTILPSCATMNTKSIKLLDENNQTAGSTFAKAIAAQPSKTSYSPTEVGELWFQLGNLYAESGRLLEAEQAYQQALQRLSQPRILHNLGLVQVRLGIDTLRKARQRLPSNDPIHKETRQYLRVLLDTAL